jgi:mannosyltransferase OCH1-like enzyme
MIPKRLHRLWLGQRYRPARYDAYWDEWQAVLPGWELFTWTEENLPELRNQALYDTAPSFARSGGILMAHDRAVAVQRADIVAYELVYQFGGVYVNCDMSPLRSLEPLLRHEAFAGLEDSQYLCNAAIGGVEKAFIFDKVIESLPDRVRAHPNAGMEYQTGPHALTAAAREHPRRITVLPIEAFYFAHHGSIRPGEDASEYAPAARAAGAYALHHWGHRMQEGDLS